MTELTIKVPSWIKEEEAEEEFLHTLMNKALLKMEFYSSKMKPFESKYGLFNEFQDRVTSASNENFKQWDDLLEWQAFHIAFVEWEGRYRELVQCLGV